MAEKKHPTQKTIKKKPPKKTSDIFVFKYQYQPFHFHPNNVELSMHISFQNYGVISNISPRFLTSQGGNHIIVSPFLQKKGNFMN